MSLEAKESVALSSVFASAAMAAMKLVVGLATGSLGILSEAAHSLLDLGAATLTYFAVRIGDQPADEKHPYGHGKVESVSALIETGLLFLTALWIVKEAVARLLSDAVEVETTWYSVAVIVVSIAIDFGRSRALSKVAKETGSQALEADALHFSSDILSSAVVLLGLGLVAIGLPKGDAVAAIGVAGFVCLAGWRLGQRTIDVLIDTAPDGIAEQVAEVAASVPGVVRIGAVRARPAGAAVFVDLTVKVSRALPFERVQAIRGEIATAVKIAMPAVEPLVVAEPLTLEDEDVAETVRIAAANRGLSVHDIGIYTLGGQRHVSFDIEVDDQLTIRAAHDIATGLEQLLAAELGGDIVIDTHIDPRRNPMVDGNHLTEAEQSEVVAEVRAVAACYGEVAGVHRIHAQRGPEGLYIAFHCAFADAAPVRRVHDVTARIEHALRARMMDVARVVVHAEPIEHIDA
ncbi:MAG: cation diffusion facilitator family transporter [Actinomycetota bacterium]